MIEAGIGQQMAKLFNCWKIISIIIIIIELALVLGSGFTSTCKNFMSQDSSVSEVAGYGPAGLVVFSLPLCSDWSNQPIIQHVIGSLSMARA
jgi:hypothetical protein